MAYEIVYDMRSVVHALLDCLPYLMLALYPFRKHLRFAPPPSIFILCGLTVWEIIFDALVSTPRLPYMGVLLIINSVICALVYILLIKENWRKAIFTLIVLTNIANIISNLSVFLEHLIFPSHVVQELNGWTFSLCTALVECAVLIPLWIYSKKIFTPVISFSKPVLWRFLWLIPCFSYSIWYYTVYIAPALLTKERYDMMIMPETSFFNLLYLFFTLLTYHVIIMQVRIETEKLALAEENKNAEIMRLQYDNLMENIEETRIARHNLKHHLSVMSSLFRSGKYGELHEYFEAYEKSMHLDAPIHYCDDETANLIIGYYATLARNMNVSFDAAVKASGTLPVERSDLGALLGNLLGNAMEACRTEDGGAEFIRLTIMLQANSILLISAQNSAGNTVLKKNGDEYFSTKHDGYGTGLFSVSRIAKKYGGSLRVSLEDNVFSARVVLYIANGR